MLARYGAAVFARFLSVDPAMESTDTQHPQTWNRFSYVFGSPLTLLDPDGQAVIEAGFRNSGPNTITNPSTSVNMLFLPKSAYAQLGPIKSPRGWGHSVNIDFVTSPDDSAANYRVRQESFYDNGPADRKGPGPDNPERKNQLADGRRLVAFDAPAATVGLGRLPGGFTGSMVGFYKTFAVANKGPDRGKQSGPAVYWTMQIQVANGTARITAREISEREYNQARREAAKYSKY